MEPPNVRPLLVYTDAMFRPRKRKRRDCDDDVLEAWKTRFVSKLGIVLYDPHCDPDNTALTQRTNRRLSQAARMGTLCTPAQPRQTTSSRRS